VHRYRLVDFETGRDLGPFVSARLAVRTGETIARRPSEEYAVANVVPTAHDEPFLAYLIVRPRSRREERETSATP
jgi:hypothetical protein